MILAEFFLKHMGQLPKNLKGVLRRPYQTFWYNIGNVVLEKSLRFLLCGSADGRRLWGFDICNSGMPHDCLTIQAGACSMNLMYEDHSGSRCKCCFRFKVRFLCDTLEGKP